MTARAEVQFSRTLVHYAHVRNDNLRQRSSRLQLDVDMIEADFQ